MRVPWPVSRGPCPVVRSSSSLQPPACRSCVHAYTGNYVYPHLCPVIRATRPLAATLHASRETLHARKCGKPHFLVAFPPNWRHNRGLGTRATEETSHRQGPSRRQNCASACPSVSTTYWLAACDVRYVMSWCVWIHRWRADYGGEV